MRISKTLSAASIRRTNRVIGRSAGTICSWVLTYMVARPNISPGARKLKSFGALIATSFSGRGTLTDGITRISISSRDFPALIGNLWTKPSTWPRNTKTTTSTSPTQQGHHQKNASSRHRRMGMTRRLLPINTFPSFTKRFSRTNGRGKLRQIVPSTVWHSTLVGLTRMMTTYFCTTREPISTTARASTPFRRMRASMLSSGPSPRIAANRSVAPARVLSEIATMTGLSRNSSIRTFP